MEPELLQATDADKIGVLGLNQSPPSVASAWPINGQQNSLLPYWSAVLFSTTESQNNQLTAKTLEDYPLASTTYVNLRYISWSGLFPKPQGHYSLHTASPSYRNNQRGR